MNEYRNILVTGGCGFIGSNFINYLKDKYPEKLAKCYVYNAPFIFTQIFNIVSMFIDKETQKKIELVKK